MNVLNSTKLVGYQSVHSVVGYFGIFIVMFVGGCTPARP